MLPNRRIILLTLDCRDNVLSVANKDFGPIEPLIAARYVKRQFAIYEAEYCRSAPAHRYHLDTRICSSRRLPSRGALNAHFRLRRRVGTVPRRAARPSREHGEGRGLPARRLGKIEKILASELRRYGYGLTNRAASLPTRQAWALAVASDAFSRLRQKGHTWRSA